MCAEPSHINELVFRYLPYHLESHSQTTEYLVLVSAFYDLRRNVLTVRGLLNFGEVEGGKKNV